MFKFIADVILSKWCKIQASKCYIEIKEAASLEVKGLLYSFLLIASLPSGSRTIN